MSEQYTYRAKIQPILEAQSRPLWSVMIPSFNCADYLRKTLASVLAQDLGPEVMQIEVIDDCSTRDDPRAVVEEMGGDRIDFYQQPKNVGYIKNFETCLQRSRGHLVHLLHGDDWICHGFYQRMQVLFDEYPNIGAAICRVLYADEKGHWKSFSPLEQESSGLLINAFQKVYGGIHIQSVGMVVRRKVYEHLGGFDNRFVCCFEDREMWVRIAAHYPIAYEVEPLAIYRSLSSESLTKRTIRSGDYARDMLKGLKIIEDDILPNLSQPIDSKTISSSRENIALFVLRLANELVDNGDIEATLNQINCALRCSNSLRVLREVINIYARIGKQKLKISLMELPKVLSADT